jgi:hypothetical protein
MKKTILLIGLALMMLTSVASAGDDCLRDTGTYCVTLDGIYTPVIAEDHPYYEELYSKSFVLKANIVADLNSKDIRVTYKDTDGSDPAIDDTSLDVNATYNETSGLIEVTATGQCGEMGYPFYGYMTIDPCDFSIQENYGYVMVLVPVFPPNVQQVTVPYEQVKVDLIGDFRLTVEECSTAIPEFPTVAIPMLAIMGLAFVMQRRKD